MYFDKSELLLAPTQKAITIVCFAEITMQNIP